MNVEDSYEGAVRRLQRLERAEIAIDGPGSDASVGAAPDGNAERMRELEELAAMACEDNERLKGELGVTLRELDERREELHAARGQLGRVQQDLETARREIETLRGCVAELQAAPAPVQPVAVVLPQQPVAVVLPAQPVVAPFPAQPVVAPFPAAQPVAAPNPSYPSGFAPFAQAPPFAEPSDDEYGFAARSRSKAGLYFFVLAVAGAIIAALCVLRPWAPSYAPPPAPVEWHVPPPPPPVPEPAAQVQPVAPKVEPAAPKAASAPAAAAPASTRKHGRHAADGDSSSDKTNGTTDNSDDPLAGTNL